MQNGYFQLVNAPGGFGIHFFPPQDGGENICVADVLQYLDQAMVTYDAGRIKQNILSQEDTVYFLGRRDCPVMDEMYRLEVSDDNMEATVFFFPPSETGSRITFEDVFTDMRSKNIVSGVQMNVLQEHFQSEGIFGTRLLVAKGKEPRHGTDARIEYYFNTDIHARPALREDGTVDFFNLNVINHCKKDDVLARIIPEDEGEYGKNIFGGRIVQRKPKKAVLKFGNHIQLSEDKREIKSEVNGHVMLVDDKVFVSDVYEVENVDLSTGNMEFEGSVQVNGNVASNYVVKAKGNVTVSGVVEGAHIVAGGNIIITRGMNGMGKGTLEAGGDVVAKFIENATVTAGGRVNAEAILHSNVNAGTEILAVGRRGNITGGQVRAGSRIEAKNLGAVMGSSTIVEVGMNEAVKAEYIQLQNEIVEAANIVKTAQPAIENYHQKLSAGVQFSEEQLRSLKEIERLCGEQKRELREKSEKMQKLQMRLDGMRKAEVVVEGTAYPGTTIIIGSSRMALQTSYQYCKFEKREGDVKMMPM